MNAKRSVLTILWVGLAVAAYSLSACSAGRDYFTEPKHGYVPYEYPHPLVSGGSFEDAPWLPAGE